MKKIKVGIIGCGAIGSSIAKALIQKFPRETALAYLCDHHEEKIQKLKKYISPKKIQTASIDKLLKYSELIIEAADTQVSRKVALYCLKHHKNAMIMSVGGLVSIPGLKRKMKSSQGKLWIPSGAVAGIDGLVAAKEGKLKRVKLVTRKPPLGLKNAPYFLKKKFPNLKGQKEYRVFQGSAWQAVKAFPQNINVSAVLSLAGRGAKATEVEIWTSHKYKRNQHEVTVEGDFGMIHSVVSNRPSPHNPKTSYLAILSALATLREITSDVFSRS